MGACAGMAPVTPNFTDLAQWLARLEGTPS